MKKYKVSLVINVIIFVLVLFALITMIMDINFMGKSSLMVASRIEALKFLTVDSNIFAGITSLLFIIYTTAYLKGKIIEIPKVLYILKYTSTVCVVLTFLVTLFFLVPRFSFNFLYLYTNSNFFFHLVIPILSFISFSFCEKSNHITFKNSFTCLVPVFIYGLFYSYNCISHSNNGLVSMKYDWYGFLSNGIISSLYVIPIIFFSRTL